MRHLIGQDAIIALRLEKQQAETAQASGPDFVMPAMLVILGALVTACVVVGIG